MVVQRPRSSTSEFSGPRPVSLLLLHGPNFWNLGDLAIFEAMVTRLAEELPSGSKFDTLSIFNIDARPREIRLPVSVNEARFIVTYPLRNVRDSVKSLVGAMVSLMIAWLYRVFGIRAHIGIRGSLGQNLRMIESCDLVISKGGNFLLDIGIGAPSYLLNLFQIHLATLFRKPVVLYSQSIGPFKRLLSKWIVFSVLKNVKLILLRESESLRYIRGLSGPIVKVTADETFTLEPASSESVTSLMHDLGLNSTRPKIGMSVINWKFPNAKKSVREDLRKRYLTTVARVAQYLIETYDADIVFFPHLVGFWGSNDNDAIHEVLRGMSMQYRCKIAPYNMTPRLAIGLAGRCVLFIGTRMHSNIFAAIAGVPVIAIGYLPKSKGIMSMIGLGDFTVDIDQVDYEMLVSRIDRAMLEHDQLSAEISRRVQLLREIASQNAHEVRVLVEGLVR